MKKKVNCLKRYLSLAICFALLLCMVANLSTTTFATSSIASRHGETYVLDDEFDTLNSEDYQFFANSDGELALQDFTVGTATDKGITIPSNGIKNISDSYQTAVVINKATTLNQYVRADFPKESGRNPMVWVRARSAEVNGKNVLIGYFVYWDNTGYIRLYKADIENDKYVLTQLARCDKISTPGGANYFLSMEICAVGSYPTVLTVKTYKNTNTNGTKAYNLYGVQTITDNTTSLQRNGKVALSTFEQNTGKTAQFLKIVYHSDDMNPGATYMVQASAKKGVLAGTVLTVEQNKTYEFSYLAKTDVKVNDSANDPVFLKYVSETKNGSNSVLKEITGFELTRTNYKGFNKFSGTFTLNSTDYPDLYVSYNNIAWDESADKLNHINVPIVIGIDLNNASTDKFEYKDFSVREVVAGNNTVHYGPNLVLNGNFTLGAFNWSDELNVGVNIGSSNNDTIGPITNMSLFDNRTDRYRTKNNRINAYQESNLFDRDYKFLYNPEYSEWGDANTDGVVNILDLIRVKKIVAGQYEYNIFADLSSYMAQLNSQPTDGEISAADLTILINMILSGTTKYVYSVTDEYLNTTLEPQTLALKESVVNSKTEISTTGKTVYYVSSAGNDDNNGLSESTPFKSINKINSLGNALKNSVVCFKRGETFRGNIVVQEDVTYTTYGEGNKPMIIGSPENGADASKWELVSGTNNIYKYATLLKDVGAIIFNDGEDFAVKRCPHIKNGAYTYGYDVLNNGEFISIVTDSRVSNIADYDSYKNSAVNTVYLRCDSGNPGTVYNSIEFSTYGYGISGTDAYVSSNYINKNITIDNLNIRYAGCHGIGLSSAQNLTVQNCEIGWIGGSIKAIASATDSQSETYYYASRYGNGVEVTGWCDGYTVENCYIHDIYDAGLTFQNGKTAYTSNNEYNNLLFSGNLIENCCYSVEYFASSSSNGINTTTINNATITNNIMRNAGVGFCEQRVAADSETADGKRGFNLGSHINGWYNYENKADNFVISNNVFDCSIYNDNSRIKSGLLIMGVEDVSDLPTMSGNTYIQHDGANFASFGALSDNLVWNAKFDANAKDFMENTLNDINGSVYFVK